MSANESTLPESDDPTLYTTVQSERILIPEDDDDLEIELVIINKRSTKVAYFACIL